MLSASWRTAVRFSIIVENFLFDMTFEVASRATDSETDIAIRVSWGKRNHSLPTIAKGHAIAQAVIRRLATAARVRAQVRLCGIYGGQCGTGAGFLRVLRFPWPSLIRPTAPHSSSSIIRGWYNMPVSGRRTLWSQSTVPQENNNNGIHINLPRCITSSLWRASRIDG
jgi:hypothetical protein